MLGCLGLSFVDPGSGLPSQSDSSWHAAAIAGLAQVYIAKDFHSRDEGLTSLHFKMPAVKAGGSSSGEKVRMSDACSEPYCPATMLSGIYCGGSSRGSLSVDLSP